MKKKKMIMAFIAAMSVNFTFCDVDICLAEQMETVSEIEVDMPMHEVEIVVDWLESGVNTPAEIAGKYKNPTNRYNILQAAIRRNVPLISALTEAFYGETKGVLPGGINNQKVVNNPAVTVPTAVPATSENSIQAKENIDNLMGGAENHILPGEEEYQKGLQYDREKNDVEAFYYYKQAADKMHPKAAHEVANMYYDGRGTSQNKDQALGYRKIAAHGGDTWGEYGYAWQLIHHKIDIKEGLLWLQKAAEHKNPRACYYLGEAYRTMDIFNVFLSQYIKPDKTKAIEYYRKAKETNTAEGYYYWGLMYYEGSLTQKNYVEAVNWFTKAMDMGDGDARAMLKKIYTYGGYGVDENPSMVSKLEGKL